MNQICVCVFAKAPIPGQVKTRLFPVLTSQQACSLHENLFQHCLSRVQDSGWQTQLWSTDIQHPYIKQSSQQHSMSLYAQQGDDLGERMHNAAKHSLEKFSYVIIIGTDCPDIDTQLIADAIDHLEKGLEVVLAPAEDGGYVLIGLSRDVECLFNSMPWGSDQVLALTRERLKHEGISWHELATQRDIDRPEDLEFLKQYYPDLFIQ